MASPGPPPPRRPHPHANPPAPPCSPTHAPPAATQEQAGVERVVGVVHHFLHDVHSQVALRRLLQEEPEAALRILTSKRGVVQQGVIDTVERLLVAEEAQAGGSLTLDRATLAYIIVRIGESFLYADVIADNQPDVDRAVEVVAQLMGT